jgi:quercetin dioxygenase-like cupin family protein
MDASQDPTVTNADLYRVVFENERVRVLEYRDDPGAKTTPHRHPDSVMVTLSSFRRRLSVEDKVAEVELPAGAARWLGAQQHSGENIGDTETHVIFVELKEPAAPGSGSGAGPRSVPLGPSS